MYSNRGDVLKVVEKMNFMGGSSDVVGVIQYMIDKMFGFSSGVCGNVLCIVIVLMDGNLNNDVSIISVVDKVR